jgi:predicted nucleic acid-binding protein
VHLSEIANVLEDAAGYRFAADLIGALLSKPTIDVVTVSAEDYLRSVHSALKFEISLNDALALTIMEDRGIDEIYTFDSHFGRTPVKVIQA